MTAESLLKSMGHKGALSSELYRTAERAIELVHTAAEHRVVYDTFEFTCEEAVRVARTELVLPGRSIKAHIENSSRIMLMAATLGSGIDDVIRTAQKSDMALAAMTDFAASLEIEAFCNKFCNSMEEKYILTSRFSPGYGDLPLEVQTLFCKTLDTQRRIGLYATRMHILIPTKSVTAIMGVN
ncbi:MAG: hypothetical protein Q4C12_03100 [Clostridia bacterium]|nr:hypothetical protein [Clostridia bacterium]